MSVKYLLHCSVAIVILLFCYGYKGSLSYEDLNELIDILKNASAMIFTIVGIWLAYIYPNAITAIVKPESVEYLAGEKDARRIEMLVGIVITSAMVIIGIVMFFVAKTLFSGLDIYIQNRGYIRPAGFSLIFFMSYMQVVTIGKVITSNILFINDFHTKLNNKKLEGQL